MKISRKSPSGPPRPADEHDGLHPAAPTTCLPVGQLYSPRPVPGIGWRTGTTAVVLFMNVLLPLGVKAAEPPYLRVVEAIPPRFQKTVNVAGKILRRTAAEAAQPPPADVPSVPVPAPAALPTPEEKTERVPATPPKPILPDTLLPHAVPEDVLPFFQAPGPDPGRSLSTATYKQQ